jgi:hypothetical protein
MKTGDPISPACGYKGGGMRMVVLAKLRGRVSQWLEQPGDGRVFFMETNGCGRQADLGQPRAQCADR